MSIIGGILALLAFGGVAAKSEYDSKKRLKEYKRNRQIRIRKGRNSAGEYVLACQYFHDLRELIDKSVEDEVKTQCRANQSDYWETFNRITDEHNKRWFGESYINAFCQSKARLKIVEMGYIPSNSVNYPSAGYNPEKHLDTCMYNVLDIDSEPKQAVLNRLRSFDSEQMY